MATITESTVKQLRREIDEALKSVAEKHGLTIEAGNATYDSTFIDFRLKVTDPQAHWDNCIKFTSLKPDDLGKIITMGKTQMIITGFDARARTKKVQLEGLDGKSYHASISRVEEALCELEPGRGKTANSSTATVPASTDGRPIGFLSKLMRCGLQGKVEYGQTFVYNRETYKIIDLYPRAPKYPIVAENVRTGMQYRFPADIVDKK